MTQKISPSVEPRVHSASVRLDGFIVFGAMVLSPAPVLPWQKRQYFAKSTLPASIAAGDEGNAAFIFFASAGTAAGPVGAAAVCASTLEAVTTAHIRATHANNPDTPRILTVSLFTLVLQDSHRPRMCQSTAREGFSHRERRGATKCLDKGVPKVPRVPEVPRVPKVPRVPEVPR